MPGAAATHKAKATKTKPNAERLQDPGRVSLSPSVSVDSLDGEPLSEGDVGDEQSSECRSGAKGWHYFAAEQPPS